MTAYIDQGEDTQTVIVSDTHGQNIGNTAICGAQTFEIIGTKPAAFSLSGSTLMLKSTSPADAMASPVTITLAASLFQYPSKIVTQTFKV